jgi:predicted phosphodiesterase
MKFLILGDVHFTDKTPASRVDNYQEEMKRKLQSVLVESEGIVSTLQLPILQPGDFTDTPFLSYSAYITLSSWVNEYRIFTIYGQHDMRYRNKGNTPLDALSESIPTFKILKKKFLKADVCIYPCSYDEDVPEIETPDMFNILLIHKMLIGKSEKMEGWKEQYETGYNFLKRSKFDLIVSGDNHRSFIEKIEDPKPRYLINCGSLMRSKIDQINHRPFYVIFDTINREYRKRNIAIRDWSEVFDIEKKIKEEQHNEEMESFVKGLSTHKEMGLNFKDNVTTYMKENNIDQAIINEVNESMNA